jgi:hypothetical protein
MVGAGTALTVATARRGEPAAVPAAFGYFTLMELLQGAGYRVIGACGTPANEVVTFLSLLHITFQPFFINAFAMELAGGPRHPARRAAVFVACGVAAVAMLLRLYPFTWAGACAPGSVMCGAALCTAPGDWHIAWSAPLNALFEWRLPVLHLHMGWTAYLLTVFVMPLVYGAWRFVLFHALVGPVLAALLTSNPNEMPAIWCLFSVGILAAGLSPWFRAQLSAPGGWGRRPEALSAASS